jgi:hypothetical protein
MQELKKIQTPRFNRRVFTSNYISSTEGDFSSHSDEPSHENNSCSEFDDREDDEQRDHRYENSMEENIFSEVLLDRKGKHFKVEAHAFSSFEMG